MLQKAELIVDLFAGGGGASQGIFQATERHPDIAINHDADAVAVHARNHPTTKHFCESIWKVEPVAACDGRAVGLLWASPDCRHFSRAAGGRPKWKSVRSLPGVVLTWAKRVRPRVIVVENVREMLGWGPLLEDGTPCPARIGRSFNSWAGRLRGLGYRVQWRELCAADFGAPTIRTRLVIVATLGDAAIIWPRPTHTKKPSMFEAPWRAAAECIDWSIPCRSIFDRKRPLKDATMRRIAEGFMRYVVNAERPYIVPFVTGCGGRTGQSPARPVDGPLGTITTKADQIIVAPHISALYGTSTGAGVETPLGTTTASGNHHALIAAHLAPMTHVGRNRGSSLEAPVPTLTCANRGEQALISATLIQTGYGEREGQAPRVPGLHKPLGTVVAGGVKHALVGAFIAQHNGGAIGRAASEPLSALTARSTQQQPVEAMISDEDWPGAERVAAFLIKYYGATKGQHQGVDAPLDTVTSKARFALVMVDGVPRPITDIRMRMLAPAELARAQGFPADYDLTDGGRLNKTGQVRLIGNSVCPDMAEAVIRSVLGYPARERLAA